MQISRRDALMGATAAAVVAVAPGAVQAGADPLREGVQTLVNEIRQHLSGELMVSVHWALHQAADRLEALPGIQAVPNEYWDNIWRQDLDRVRYGPVRVLRLAGEART